MIEKSGSLAIRDNNKPDNSLLDQGHAHGHQRSNGSIFITTLFYEFALIENIPYITNWHHTRNASPRLAAHRLAHTQALLKLILGKPFAEIIFNLRENALTQKNNTRSQAKSE